ncbi:MAG: hypothetical protein QW115_06930 [Thermoplasmata archaeon]
MLRANVVFGNRETKFEGDNVSMAIYGYSRDHRSDRKQAVILLVLVDEYPVYSYVFEGNKRDVSVFLDVVKDLKERLNIEARFVADPDISLDCSHTTWIE